MNEPLASPPFGHANLSNCERELIHLAGSIQPHGFLMVLHRDRLTVLQASENIETITGLGVEFLLNRPISVLGGDLETQIRSLLETDLAEPATLRCRIVFRNQPMLFEGVMHRLQGGEIIVELELQSDNANAAVLPGVDGSSLQKQLSDAVHRFSSALTIPILSETVVTCVRDMTGYDRVMVYRFDPDGHGEIIAEARDSSLESLLGHHYPATDIPQRARQLYLQNRVRLLVDVGYLPVPIVPRCSPDTGEELDMSLCALRSMSPLHLQYLKNMGVTGTLVVSLVREGRLWGLIACHHYSPRRIGPPMRAALELLAEVISTRIAAIENYVHAQVEVLVQRLELRLIEATSTDGDWRQALFSNPRTLLQPLGATGAALYYDGEIMIAGDVPSTPDLRALMQWIAKQPFDPLFSCSSVARMNPALASLTATASGVLVVPLTPSRPDYLMWFRKEQPCEYTWAGDPAKPLLNDDPLTLSPRRSFAAWSEIVRGSAAPWTRAESVLAKAFGDALVNIILQIHAVRLLIVQHQMELVRAQIVNSKDPVLIADPQGHVLFSNESLSQLLQPRSALHVIEDLATHFIDPEQLRSIFHSLKTQRASWRGELGLIGPDLQPIPVWMRADVLPGEGSSILGFIITLRDLRAKKQLESARQHFEAAILHTARNAASVGGSGSPLLREPDEVIGAIIANANVAAMEIADVAGDSPVTGLLEELENSTQRAAALYRQLWAYKPG